MNKGRIDYFLSHPIQYFSPFFRELGGKADLTVHYYSDASIKGYRDAGFGKEIKWDVPLLAGYNSVFLQNRSTHKNLDNRLFDVINPSIWKVVRNSKSEVFIVHGWAYSTDICAIIIGRLLGKRIWIRSENPLNQELRKSSIKIFVKKLFLKHFLFKYFVDRGLYIGSQSKEFFKYFGVRDERLTFTPHAVDNGFFQERHLELKRNLPEIKSSLGIESRKKVILFSGKYIFKKRPMDLIRAFHMLNRPDAVLVMMGEGMLRGEMEGYISDNDVDNVFLTGFVNQSEISKYYAICDVYVMCSGMGETWGLALNEAMNFSKPVIVSDTCGSSSDLVDHGENGFVFKEGDVAELARYLGILLDDENLRGMAGEKSFRRVSKFSIHRTVDNLISELKQI